MNGAAPILLAANGVNQESTNLILNNDDVHPDERDSRRSTPLSLAAAKGHEGIVLLLLKYGARDVFKREKPGRQDLLSWAAGHGMADVVKKLLQIPEIIIDSIDEDSRTPLSRAAGNGHLMVVSHLLRYANALDSGVTIDCPNGQERTPLSWAAAAGHKDVVETLLSHQADPTKKANAQNSLPLHY